MVTNAWADLLGEAAAVSHEEVVGADWEMLAVWCPITQQLRVNRQLGGVNE